MRLKIHSLIPLFLLAPSDGVKVSTTIRKLLESLAATTGDFTRISCFIGKVQYQGEADLVDLLDNQQLMESEILHPSGTGQAWTLIFKRQEFSHEEEVRLVYFNHDKSYTGDLFSYPIGDPSRLIDEVVFDPRLPESSASWPLSSRGVGRRGHKKHEEQL